MFINSKNTLRSVYKSVRNGIEEQLKVNYDYRIFTLLVNSDIFKNADLILTYVSVGSEADTRRLIDYSIKKGKHVAIPFCKGKEMFFYEIGGLDELTEGKFGIPTVNTGYTLPVDSFHNALCIVPGLCFDLTGNRIGYGGGFYDRFLDKHKVPTVALAYERCICSKIPNDAFDVKTDNIITENYIKETLCKEASTYE